MAIIKIPIDLNVPVQTAYHRLTRCEEFRQLMEGVTDARRTEDRHLHRQTEIDEQDIDWETEIVEQTRDECIAWVNRSGVMYGGIVTFKPLPAGKSQILLELGYFPENGREELAMVSFRVQRTLERFKAFIEKAGHEAETCLMDPTEKLRSTSLY